MVGEPECWVELERCQAVGLVGVACECRRVCRVVNGPYWAWDIRVVSCTSCGVCGQQVCVCQVGEGR